MLYGLFLFAGAVMSAPRIVAAALLACALVILVESRTVGQATPKTKVKPGAPLVAEPNDLPKAGAPLSGWALVQRPAALKNVRSWTIETKRHRWIMNSIAVSPEGKRLATSGYDGIVRIWDTETGNLERALVGHEGSVAGLAWSPDGKYLASAGYFNAHVWDTATGMTVRILRGKYGVSLVAWSPDGTKLLTGGGGSGQLALWDVAAGKRLVETEYGNPIGSIAFASTGDHVAATASRAGTYISDSNKLKTEKVFKDTLDADYAVAFSPDGKQMAAGSSKQTVIYDCESGAVVKKLKTPGFALTFTPKGGLLVAGTGYAVTPYSPGEFVAGKPLPGLATVLSLNAEGNALFGLYRDNVTYWDLEKLAVVRTINVADFTTLICGPSTSVVVPGTTTTLWDATTGKQIGPLDDHKGGVVAWAWGPTGKTLALAGLDNRIRIYEPSTAKLLRTLATPAAVSALAVSADGKVAASIATKKVVLWPAAGDQPSHTLEGFSKPAPVLAWTHDGQLLATAADKKITIWSAETGKPTKALEHPRPVHSVTWSTDGTRLLVGSSDDVALAAYQASTWKLLPALDKGTTIADVATQWSPDGAVLLGYRNSAIQQWNGKTGKVGTAFGSPGSATSIAFWMDGRTIAGGCVDRAARYWDAVNGKLRMTLVAERDQVFTIAADGNYRCPASIESELIAVVTTDKVQETLPLKEFAAKYGFKNAPGNVK
jgi:WD40 repeat protein